MTAVLQASVHWTTLYTQRLNNDVKLVGSTINCQPIFWLSDTANEMRHNPHVQSYVVATDKVIACVWLLMKSSHLVAIHILDCTAINNQPFFPWAAYILHMSKSPFGSGGPTNPKGRWHNLQVL